MRELSCFTGVGGGLWGTKLLGFDCVQAIEINPYCRDVLRARQADGSFGAFPIHDDIRTFDATGIECDVVTGGFPCQDISSSNPKGAGVTGEKSGLVFEMLRIIRESRTPIGFFENSPLLRNKGAIEVLNGLAAIGHDAQWGVLSAGSFGAFHERARFWILSYTNEGRRIFKGMQTSKAWETIALAKEQVARMRWWPESRVPRVVDGVPNWKHRVGAVGNAQSPIVAAMAFRLLAARAVKFGER